MITTSRRIRCLFARFLREREGASVIEYALLVGIIGAALFGVLGSFQTGLSDFFGATSNKLKATTPQ